MHHKVCHVLGGTFNLPHARTHATLLPYVMAFNAAATPAAEARAAAAFGTATALEGLQGLLKTLEAPTALTGIGFTEAGITEAFKVVLPLIPTSNPRTLTAENLAQLLTAALKGDDSTRLTFS